MDETLEAQAISGASVSSRAKNASPARTESLTLSRKTVRDVSTSLDMTVVKWRTVTAMQDDLERVLFDQATIVQRLDEIAAQISADYRDRELTVIAILNGSLMFMADLLRRIPLPLRLDCLSVASYHGGLQTSGEVIFRQIAQPDVAGRHILVARRHSRQRHDDQCHSRKITDRVAAKYSCLRFAAEIKRAGPADRSGLRRIRYRRRICRRLWTRLSRAVSQSSLHWRIEKGAGQMMKVRVELYSRLKEIVDASLLELSLPENATVKDLFEQLKERYPQLRDFERSVLFGIGVEFVDRNHPLNEGDTIAIMPPVQGG